MAAALIRVLRAPLPAPEELAAMTDRGPSVGPRVPREIGPAAGRRSTTGSPPGAAIPGYRVAGKTGTAERAGKNGRYDDTFTVSFAGFAPADQPRFTVYVLVQNPRNGGGGGSVAGPAFSKIMNAAPSLRLAPRTGTKPSTYPVEY